MNAPTGNPGAGADPGADLGAADQRELLKQLLAQRAQPKSEAPASCAQRRLWLVTRLEEASPAYNLPCHIVLRGTLNAEALRNSFIALAQRHASLRTTFHDPRGEPVQRIASAVTVELPSVDLAALSRSEACAEIRRLIAQDAAALFDLERGPLFRLRLVRVSDHEHVLILVMHHIISDGWSMGVLMRDLFGLYAPLCRGEADALPHLPINYLDYSERQSRWLRSEACAAQLGYWTERLRDLPTLALPTDRPRPAVKQSRGAMHVSVLDAELSRTVERYCGRAGLTPFMFLLAAFSALLARYSGQTDIVVGTPIANRNSVDTEGLIGFFVNTLVLRTDLSGDPTVQELLRRAADGALGAYANQDLPFERLVEELRPERDTSRNPLFQVIMAVQNEPMPGFALDGLEVGSPVSPGSRDSEFDVDTATTRFDLELHFWESAAGLRCVWFYDVALFDAATIAQMGRHLAALVRGMLDAPTRRISELDLLSAAERATLLDSWARNPTRYPRDATVHALFERQAAASPDAVAVAYGDDVRSYRELNVAANRLARHLDGLGVRPGALVALCMERGCDMIVAMLAILKSGCAYVPLDTEYPAARLTFMLKDTAAAVLITQSSLQARLPAYAGHTLCLDRDWPTITMHDASDPPLRASADAFIYVMYTSGSTGEPKGVAIPHRGVVRLVRDTDYVQLTPEDRVVQASNASFDAATFEIWGALLNGACLVGVARDTTLVPVHYAAFLREQRITVMFMTTALFNQIALEKPDAFAGLRALLVGGEAADVECVRRVLRSPGRPQRLLNVYGPTESTTFASWHEVGAVGDSDVTVPIGGPLANTELYVLDPRLQPVPVGVAGELYIGGDGLARGYWQRPQLTDERFVANPHAAVPGARLYRTGDLVRWRHPGVIEFLGRIDQQVKLRGFRIELGEIETCLKQCADVREALVIVHEAVRGDRQLVAYVVTQAGATLAVADLRRHLQTALPAFMLPSAIVALDNLPLTPNGKVDRKRLPQPQLQRQISANGVAPRNELEHAIAALWREVLGIQDVGIDDNFFDLGGDSFRLVRVHAGLQQLLGRDVSVTELFRCSTVRALAQRFGAAANEVRESGSRVRERADRQRAALQQRRPTPKE